MKMLDLPPLGALRAFEAAARLSSFTKAGEELGMTQAAVSYQIRALEDRIGKPLFIRKPRQVVLTSTGRDFAPRLRDALEQISSAYDEARGTMSGTIVISTVQTFATHWLMDNLHDFQERYPALNVRVDASQRLSDFAEDGVDLAIRGTRAKVSQLEQHLLVDANFTPMLSPQLAENAGGIKEPSDLLSLPLLDPKDIWWKLWFEPLGLWSDAPHPEECLNLGSQSLVARAAIAGRGVAMLTPALYKREIALGLLTQPFERLGHDGLGFYLVYPKGRHNAPKIRAFREWILNSLEGQNILSKPA